MWGENVAEHHQLRVGDLAYDTVKGVLGVVMDTSTEAGLIYLRPQGGGVEWTVQRDHVRLATATDQLRPTLAAVNAQSLRRASWG
ncbi:hypothetical protein ACWD6I_04375 [Streptomyces sp. NPDC002454]